MPLRKMKAFVQTARKTAAAATISVEKLRGNVSVLMGAGGNIAVLPGRDGKLLIDAGFAGARPKISDALGALSSDPIKNLINTHWHFDHTDGNEWVHSADAAILAHANTRKRLSATTRVEGWNFTFSPCPAGAIPAEVFDDERTVKLNGTTIALKYYGPAHTDGDISVYFTEADILGIEGTPKNGEVRHVPIDASVVAEIKKHLNGRSSGLVWQSNRGTPLRLNSVLRWQLKPILKKLGSNS